MGENGQTRANLPDEELGVRNAQVQKVWMVAPLKPQGMDDQDVASGIGGEQSLRELGVGDEGNHPLGEKELEAVGFNSVNVAKRSRKAKGPQGVLPSLNKDVETFKVFPKIPENHRFFSQGILRHKEVSPNFRGSLGHGLNDDVEVSGMVEVPVGKHNSRQRRRIKGRLAGKGPYQRAGSRIKVQGSALEGNPHTSGSPELPRNHETRSRRSQEFDEISHQGVLYWKRKGA